jgi:hypothetical protein
MIGRKAAMTLAEGAPDFKVDATIVFNNQKAKNGYVLRTSYNPLGLWKTKYSMPVSPFKLKHIEATKQAAFVQDDVWVFGVDGTKTNDVVAAVKIGMHCYQVNAQDLLGDIYVKNLNVEQESGFSNPALVRANKRLYQETCQAVLDAARILGIRNVINFWVFSNSQNPKIPGNELHEAFSEGGADSVKTDETATHKFMVGSNDGIRAQRIKTHLHFATLKP